jgi:hypothetical protein
MQVLTQATLQPLAMLQPGWQQAAYLQHSVRRLLAGTSMRHPSTVWAPLRHQLGPPTGLQHLLLNLSLLHSLY